MMGKSALSPVVPRRWRGFRLDGRRRRGGVAEIIATLLLVAITVALVFVLYLFRFPLSPPPPLVSYQVVTGMTRPVWGDPTDCYPNTLPNPPSYYLGPGKSNTLYTEYMDAWWDDCEYGSSGTYRNMNVTAIQIVDVSQTIPLADLEFQFVCTNKTPSYVQTNFVEGPLDAMEWEPGTNENLSSSAPTLGDCATSHPNGNGANSVYYNRLGYFDPLFDYHLTYLAPGQTIYIYVHTPDSVLEAPNPIEAVDKWNVSDGDDYHGAPPWCFTVPGACTVNLIDTAWNPAIIVLSVPLNVV